MAAIYLGTSTSGSGAIELPPLRWLNGSDPGIPTDYSKQIDKSRMIDGSQRFNYRSKHPRKWALQWEMLTVAEFAVMLSLNEINDSLYFQNNWEDATWREVTIMDFTYTPIVRLGATGCRYNLSMTLEEVRQ